MTKADDAGDSERIHLISEFKHERPLTSCCWSPDGQTIFFGAEDNLVHRYHVADQKTHAYAGHDSWVRAMAVSKNGQRLITGGYDGRLMWWSANGENSESIRQVEAHSGWIRGLAISPDDQLVATCGNDRLVKLWDAEDGRLVRELSGHMSHVYRVCFAPDGRSLVSCDLKGTIREWPVADGGDGRDVVTIEALHKYDTTFRADIGGARSIAFRSDGAQLAIGGITNVTNAFAGIGEIAIALVDRQQGTITQLLESKDKLRGAAWGVSYHPDGFWIAVAAGGGGGWVYFWKGDQANEFYKIKLKNDGRGMSLSDDQQRLAIAHADAHLRIYQVRSEARP